MVDDLQRGEIMSNNLLLMVGLGAAVVVVGAAAYFLFFNKRDEQYEYVPEEESNIVNLDDYDEKYYIDVNYPGWYRAYEGFHTPYIPPFTGEFWPYTKTPQPSLLPIYPIRPPDVPRVPTYPF